jgi:hypothetical protein
MRLTIKVDAHGNPPNLSAEAIRPIAKMTDAANRAKAPFGQWQQHRD